MGSSYEWQIVPVQGLASRHRLRPLVSDQLDGRQIAIHLESLFRRYGAPLFLKRDHGSPLQFCDTGISARCRRRETSCSSSRNRTHTTDHSARRGNGKHTWLPDHLGRDAPCSCDYNKWGSVRRCAEKWPSVFPTDSNRRTAHRPRLSLPSPSRAVNVRPPQSPRRTPSVLPAAPDHRRDSRLSRAGSSPLSQPHG